MKFLLLLTLASLSLAATLHAQSNAARTPPPLGLLRLKSERRTGDAALVVATKYSVDDLSAAGVVGASKSKRNSANYLALGAGKFDRGDYASLPTMTARFDPAAAEGVCIGRVGCIWRPNRRQQVLFVGSGRSPHCAAAGLIQVCET